MDKDKTKSEEPLKVTGGIFFPNGSVGIGSVALGFLGHY